MEITTLSDLEICEMNGIELSSDQEIALNNFRKLRLAKLKKKVGNEKKFHSQFEYFRNLSNTENYTVMLDNKFCAS